MSRLKFLLQSSRAGSRILALWTGLSGAFALLSGNCPCCGRPGCPVGLGIAGTLGLLGSILVMYGRRLLTVIRNLGPRKENPKEPV